MIRKTCCFTGLRPQKLTLEKGYDTYDNLMKKLDSILMQLIEKYNVKHYISGMALGFDTWCAEKVLDCKELYGNIQLCCMIPCRQQDRFWSYNDKKTYWDIIRRSDKVVTLQEYYTSDCMLKINKKMVDESMYLVALWDGQSGETSQTINYALSCDKNIVIIDPRDLTIRTHKTSKE